jgi:hypothetical protein
MTARRTHPLRLILEISLVLALILILTAGGFWAQARSGNPAPAGSAAAEVLATPIPSVQAGLMAAEMAALTPPQYIVTMPIVQR